MARPAPTHEAAATDDDQLSFSLVSTAPDVETLFSHADAGYDTDDFELPPSSWDHEASCGESTSISPSVYDNELVHGRRYHGYRKGRYPFPNDVREQQREEMMHALMLEITEGHLFFSEIGTHPQKIIDIGTGIGSWAIDVADLYPSASVIGTDLSPIQPTWVPVNVRMFVDDCEAPDWLHGSAYDLVFFRSVAGALQDIDAVLARAYTHIRHGGWIEFQEFVPQILCDDGTVDADDPLRVLYEAAVDGMRSLGCDPLRPAYLDQIIARAGFTNVRCIIKKIPICGWARDAHLKMLGHLTKAVVLESLDALAAKPLDALGFSPGERQELLRRAEKSLEDTTAHRYVNCYFCYAQKRETGLATTDQGG